jgi:hypothetical protein
MAEQELGVPHPRIPGDVVAVGVTEKMRVDVRRGPRAATDAAPKVAESKSGEAEAHAVIAGSILIRSGEHRDHQLTR